MNMDRDLTDDELELLEIAGADDDLVVFVNIFPRSSTGRTVLEWFEHDILTAENAAEGQPYSGGHFFDTLWSGDTEDAFAYADTTNKQHLKTLFGDPTRGRLEALE